MKIKDLLLNREKLRKYDELKEWKEKLSYKDSLSDDYIVRGDNIGWVVVPTRIRDIFVSALETEIAKLNEE